MVLLVYRIKANVPVIIMGDTGCGKTALITKLNQLMNNGKTTVEKINIHPGINDDKLCDIMKEKDEIAKDLGDNKELWLFFDEINTCPSLSLITEIFINRTYNGNKFSDNIRLIGACNPYRKRVRDKEKCGLSHPGDNESESNELVYLVNPLPQSLLYYVFSFGSIDPEDEKKYIHSIIEVLFPKDEKERLKSLLEQKKNDQRKKEEEKNKEIFKQKTSEEKEDFKKELERLDVEIKTIQRELKFHDITTEAISKCHEYLRKTYDPSVVSLREIARFPKLVEFFLDYFRKKNNFEKRENNEKNNKIRSIICAIYLCYYIRLTEEDTRDNFEKELRDILLKLVTYQEPENGKLREQIQIEDLKMEIEKIEINEKRNNKLRVKIDEKFSDFLKIEEDYLIKQIKPDKGIGKNTLLKENSFLLFVSIVTNIPLIIIGKPGTGKSLSVQLLIKSMKGEYSTRKFFKLYPKLIHTYFQGSLSTTTIDVENLFKKVSKKLEHYKELKKTKFPQMELPISLACFDELGLAERSKNNPLKALHPELDYAGNKKNESFVGISNYSLDAAKLNRALVLSVPDLDKRKDELFSTAIKIVKSIEPNIVEEKIFEIISNTYFEYKKELQFIKELVVCEKYMSLKNKKIQDTDINENNSEASQGSNIDTKEKVNIHEKGSFQSIKEDKIFKELMIKDKKIRNDFHGNRDFYSLVRGIANALRNPGEIEDSLKIQIITNFIERNFGGIEYKIDINFDSTLEDISKKVGELKSILEDYDLKKQIKLNSVFLFKKLYNLQCDKLDPTLKIDNKDIGNYNINNCINENINNNINDNSRYLLLELRQSLTQLIVQNIKLETFKEIKLYDGSPFPNDDNNEYKFKIINEIREDAKHDRLIIIENLNQIHPFLFDLYNMNYEIQDEEKYARICLDSFRELKTLVNDRFRIIIMVNKKFIEKCNLAFLNRLEKINLSFDKLLDEKLDNISKNIIKDINLKDNIKDFENEFKPNYSFKDLLINCGDPEIQGLIYYYSKVPQINGNDGERRKENMTEKLKDVVINKIYKILPQDIISCLGKDDIIRKKYTESKNVFNFKDYKNEIKKEINKEYKISIIYTFTNISNNVEGEDREMSFMISQVKSENEFENKIDEKKKNDNQEKYIYIHFDQSNSNKIKFISNYILYKTKDNYKYIFIIHINRNFNKAKDENSSTMKNRKSNMENETIYSLPDINQYINQIFIDNLNADNKITLKDLLEVKNIKEIAIKLKDELKLDYQFNKSLTNFLREELEKTTLDEECKEEYIREIVDYMDRKKVLKEEIIEIAYNLKDNSEQEKDNSDLIGDIFKNKLVNKFTVDIVTCLTEYIKEELFIKSFKNIFKLLENNNILTTLIELNKREPKILEDGTVVKIVLNYLKQINLYKYDNCKFLFNYNIPGFYNFYVELSNFINRNITTSYFNEEKIIRGLLKDDESKIDLFHKKEESFLLIINKEISENHKFIFDNLANINDDIFFKDYTTYYLQKYRNIKDAYKFDDIYHKIIELLLKLRFNTENIDKNDQLKSIIWIESNMNYILKILKIVDEAKKIFNDDDNKLYEEIQNLYNEGCIKYITNEKKNAKITTEVSQCYYILLAIICYCITSDDIKLDKIEQYYSQLKEINKILQSLNDELYIYLNEMYIIDELIKVIEIFKKKNDIEKINNIKYYIRENANIIQNFSNSEDINELSENLINNFEEIYNLIIEDEDKYKDDLYFFDKLRYIIFKEIKKNNDVNYRYKILEKLLEHNTMIKKSNDIFQIVLKNYLNKNNYKDNINRIKNNSNEDSDIINLIDNNIKNNTVLAETLFYLFEKNSFNYYNSILNNRKKPTDLDGEPLQILKDCIEFLKNYINKPDETNSKTKEFCKIFCLSYIKIYCFIMFNSAKPKCKNPNSIIKTFNAQEPLYKMIRLYIYKILFNNFTLDNLKDVKIINKYGLKELIDFKEFIDIKEINDNSFMIDYKVETLKEGAFINFKEELEKYKTQKFKEKIITRNFNVKENGIDNFYVASYNSILANLLSKSTDIKENFFKNVCNPLFNGENLIINAIELFYNPHKFDEIKNIHKIDSSNIKPLLYGYRYCLNELSAKNTSGIYYSLYDKNKLSILRDKFYPGNDTKFNLVYFQVINHFKTKPEAGCYVCLCETSFYHSVLSGFPGKDDILFNNMSCPYCNENIGTYKNKIVKRDKYFRIFKDEAEIAKINKNKLKEINYMTLKYFKENYMEKSYQKEKGICINDKNNFRNDNKIIRNLSQVSYRLLNYILYCHLFFARLITNKPDFDKYLPKDLDWIDTLNECWNILSKELSDLNIDSIDKFMNYCFVFLFPKLNSENYIDNYDKLIEIENNLESEIQNCIKNYDQYYKNMVDNGDKDSLINLVTEKYTHEYYIEKEKEYPFYHYFYYTNYIDEKFIKEKISHSDENKYPVLRMYLENKMKDKSDRYLFDNIHIFNNALNLISQIYFNNISKEDAEKTMIKDSEFCKSNTENNEKEENTENIERQNNKEILDEFFIFYNNVAPLLLKDKKKLGNENHLSDLFIHDDNKIYGKNYIIIYKTIIEEQNKKIKELLKKKGILDITTLDEVSVQQLNEDEVFNLNLPKKISFTDILFNSSYRKILDKDPVDYSLYKEYVINLDYIEEYMTDLLLNNKKLLNDTITKFIYKNELFSYQITNILTIFTERYNVKEIILDDKVSIYKFCKENKNHNIYKGIINDFINLIKFLNNNRKENNDNQEIKNETKIYDILDKLYDVSNYFKKFFERSKDSLTVCKTKSIFDYYLKVIYDDVASEIKEYQEEMDDELKDKINEFYKTPRYINKVDLAYAIRLFVILVLYREEDKEKKIKLNQNNIINYLIVQDLWKNKIDNNEKFHKDLDALKLMDIHICKTIPLYEVLGKDIEDNFFEDVDKKIESEKPVHEQENFVENEMNLHNGENNNNNQDDDNDDDEDDSGIRD